MQRRSSNFVQAMNAQLIQYQLQKAIRLQSNQPKSGQHYHKQTQAKQTLIELDDEADITKNTEQDIFIGRWSNYRVPQRADERLSLSKKTKRGAQDTPTYRYIDRERAYLHSHGYPTYSRSERTIPKLKVMLHQLECPLDLPSSNHCSARRNSSTKMKNHFGTQALVISNKLEIKSVAKSQRKNLAVGIQGIGENKRPGSGNGSHFKAHSSNSGYEKIKRNVGGGNDCQLVYEKEILSQLIKGNINRGEGGPLANMLNYFTMSGGDTKRKVSAKLGLDRLLS